MSRINLADGLGFPDVSIWPFARCSSSKRADPRPSSRRWMDEFLVTSPNKHCGFQRSSCPIRISDTSAVVVVQEEQRERSSLDLPRLPARWFAAAHRRKIWIRPKGVVRSQVRPHFVQSIAAWSLGRAEISSRLHRLSTIRLREREDGVRYARIQVFADLSRARRE
jgi:hypothetical protein